MPNIHSRRIGHFPFAMRTIGYPKVPPNFALRWSSMQNALRVREKFINMHLLSLDMRARRCGDYAIAPL